MHKMSMSIGLFTWLSIIVLMFNQDVLNSEISYSAMYVYFSTCMIISFILDL